MKKTLRFLAVCLVISLFALVFVALMPARQAEALTNPTPASGGGFYDGRVNESARDTLSNSLTAYSLALVTAQGDTNVTVNATLSTARFRGDLLIGLVSNKVFIAPAAGTNWISLN